MAVLNLHAVARDQRTLVWLVMGALLCTLTMPMLGYSLLILWLVAGYWCIRVMEGMGYGLGARAMFAVAMVIPGINLVGMFIINVRAQRLLRREGYRIGLLWTRGV